MQQSQLNEFNMPPLLLQVKLCEYVELWATTFQIIIYRLFSSLCTLNYQIFMLTMLDLNMETESLQYR